MSFLATVLSPEKAEVHQLGSPIWIEAVQNSNDLPKERRISLFSFSLALSFMQSSQAACTLVTLTFDEVHEAAAEERLGYEAWKLFDEQVPLLSAWRNWDRCERLRRGLIDRFEEHQWPVLDFAKCAKRKGTLKDLLRTCADYRPRGRTLLDRMRMESDSLKRTLNEEFWREIRRNL
jgi:hypothetical protein